MKDLKEPNEVKAPRGQNIGNDPMGLLQGKDWSRSTLQQKKLSGKFGSFSLRMHQLPTLSFCAFFQSTNYLWETQWVNLHKECAECHHWLLVHSAQAVPN